MEESEKPLEDQKRIYAKWLEKMQQESWQLELIISGIVLYIVFAAREYIENLGVFAEMHWALPIVGAGLNFFHAFIYGSWVIFIINLVVHIISRGFWIGAIGLRYVSGEVKYGKLGYSEIFQNYLERKVGRFDDFIERIERFCSILYAYTFLLFFMFLSILIFFGIIFLVVGGIEHFFGESEDSEMILGLWFIGYFILGFLYAIDSIFMGPFKKIKDRTVSKVYFFVYSFFNIVTLSFLYRILYYNFIDHKYSRRFFWISIPYFLFIFVIIPSIEVTNSVFFPTDKSQSYVVGKGFANWMYYDDLRRKFLNSNKVSNRTPVIHSFSMEEFEITKSMSSFFIRLRYRDEEYMENILKLSPKRDKRFRTRFHSSHRKDTVRNKIEEYYSQKRIEVLKERRASDHPERMKIAQNRIDSLRKLETDSLSAYYYNSEKQIYDAFLSLFQVEINEVSYTDSIHCVYFIHPNNGEKGFRCFYPVSSLDNGLHHFRLGRKFFRERESGSVQLDTNFTQLPIFINRAN